MGFSPIFQIYRNGIYVAPLELGWVGRNILLLIYRRAAARNIRYQKSEPSVQSPKTVIQKR